MGSNPQSNIIQIIVLAVLLVLSGFFSAAETALTTVSLSKLRVLIDESGHGSRKAKRILKMREDSGKMLSAILIGNNIVNLSASSLATIICTRFFGSVWVGVATGILTFFILIFGEITPKTLATLYNLQLSMFFSGPVAFLMLILTPFIWILNGICRGLFRLIGIDPDNNPNALTEGELLAIVDASNEEGVIELDEKKMINNVVDFGDALSKDIMVPRADMISANIDATYDEILALIEEENYSRIPIYKESKDHIVGILHVKDLFMYREKHGRDNISISQLMRKPVYVYEYQRTAQIFADMKTSSVTMCIVLDEYGITAGLITMEDLIEEIVGDIRDEYDAGEDELIRRLGDGHYDVDAGVKLDDLNDAIGTTLESDDYDSVGGLVIELLDRLPEQGDTVTCKAVTFKVVSMNRNRAERIDIVVDETYKDEESEDEEP